MTIRFTILSLLLLLLPATRLAGQTKPSLRHTLIAQEVTYLQANVMRPMMVLGFLEAGGRADWAARVYPECFEIVHSKLTPAELDHLFYHNSDIYVRLYALLNLAWHDSVCILPYLIEAYNDPTKRIVCYSDLKMLYYTYKNKLKWYDPFQSNVNLYDTLAYIKHHLSHTSAYPIYNTKDILNKAFTRSISERIYHPQLITYEEHLYLIWSVYEAFLAGKPLPPWGEYERELAQSPSIRYNEAVSQKVYRYSKQILTQYLDSTHIAPEYFHLFWGCATYLTYNADIQDTVLLHKLKEKNFMVSKGPPLMGDFYVNSILDDEINRLIFFERKCPDCTFFNKITSVRFSVIVAGKEYDDNDHLADKLPQEIFKQSCWW